MGLVAALAVIAESILSFLGVALLLNLVVVLGTALLNMVAARWRRPVPDVSVPVLLRAAGLSLLLSVVALVIFALTADAAHVLIGAACILGSGLTLLSGLHERHVRTSS